jgi:hypothetical protein
MSTPTMTPAQISADLREEAANSKRFHRPAQGDWLIHLAEKVDQLPAAADARLREVAEACSFYPESNLNTHWKPLFAALRSALASTPQTGERKVEWQVGPHTFSTFADAEAHQKAVEKAYAVTTRIIQRTITETEIDPRTEQCPDRATR